MSLATLRKTAAIAFFLQTKEEDIRTLKVEQTRIRQLRDNLNVKLQQAEKDKGELERQKDDIKAQIAGMERGQCKMQLEGNSVHCIDLPS